MRVQDSQSGAKKLLAKFLTGSLIVILVSLSMNFLWLAAQHVNQEKMRANLSRQQISNFFRQEYPSLAEDMWSLSYESIGEKISDIASQLKSDSFEVFIADANGKCTYHRLNETEAAECTSPPQLNELVQNKIAYRKDLSSLQYDDRRHQNVYVVPLGVGSIIKGYLFAAVSDPFDFYRGNSIRLAFKNWLPSLIALILVWGAWLWISRKYLIAPYLSEIIRLEKNEALVTQAQQVAHDLRNPLTAILCVVRTLKEIPSKKKELIIGAAESIRDIADDLLKQPEPTVSAIAPTPLSVYSVSRLAKTVVEEAKYQHRERESVRISLENVEAEAFAFKPGPIELKRILHNVITNAVEAINGSGTVRVTVKKSGTELVVKVIDSGKGAPANIIPKLGKKGASFGKARGMGLGLFHAKQTLKAAGGELLFESAVGKGTTVSLVFPAAAISPKMDVLEVKAGGNIAILDDETTSHQHWDIRFGELQSGLFKIVHFKTPEELRNWWVQQVDEVRLNTLFLCDFFLGKGRRTGLEVIEELGVQKQAVLVTGLAGDPTVQARCQRMSVPLLAKEQVSSVRIQVVG